MKRKDKILLTLLRVLNFLTFAVLVITAPIKLDCQNLKKSATHIFIFLIFTIIRMQYFNNEIYVKVYYILEAIFAILVIFAAGCAFLIPNDCPDDWTYIVIAIMALIGFIGILFMRKAAKNINSKK